MIVREHAHLGLCSAALRWAERGRPVLPVGEHKRPFTANGLLDATTDADTIAGWWKRWPQANVAIRTGQASGLVVLDVDGDAGADSLHVLEREHGELPATTSVTTPRGGAHFYFRWPGREVKTCAGVIAPGIDVRGDGGYAVVPPSIGANGRPYEWDDITAPAPMPTWLLTASDRTASHRLGPSRRAAEPVDTWVSLVRHGLAEGERNAGLARLVGHLLARDVDARLVAELAHLVNSRSRPPLHAEEVDRVVASIAGREVRRRREPRR